MRLLILALLLAAGCPSKKGIVHDPWTRNMRLIPRKRSRPRPLPPVRAQPGTPDAKVAALPPRSVARVDLDRAQLEAVLAAGPQRFMAGISLAPYFLDRKFIGFRLERFYDGDPRFARVDLRRGDVVVRVNGLPIGRPEQFMRVWSELKGADEIRVDFLRGPEKRLLRVRIR